VPCVPQVLVSAGDAEPLKPAAPVEVLMRI